MVGALVYAIAHGVAALPAIPVPTVRAGIELTMVGTPLDVAERWPAITSPDGSASIVELYRGDVTHDMNRYRLLLFQRRGSGTWRPTKDLVSLASRDLMNIAGLAHPSWSRDSRRIFVLAADAKGISQIDSVSPGGGMTPLTASRTGIVDYAFDSAERTLVYLERRPRPALTARKAGYAGILVTDQSPYALLRGRQEPLDYKGYGGGLELVVRTAGRPRRIELPTGEWPIAGAGLSVSPGGRYVAIPVTMARRLIPQDWQRLIPDESWVWISGLRLFDRRTGSLSWLVRAPTDGGAQQAVSWSADERYALVNGVIDTGPGEKVGAQAMIIRMATATGVASFPGSFSLERTNADLRHARLIRADRPGESLRIAGQGDHWSLVADGDPAPMIELSQSFRQKQLLVDFDRKTGSSTTIYDPNPQWRMASLNPVRAYRWTSGGRDLDCGLYLPRTLLAGHRYPLIIQTHGWSPDKFWYDGVSTAGYAAQALASAGFIVAQVNAMPGVWSSPREGPANAAMFDDLIDALDRDGLVDPSRVGITGWSRTGIAVRYALAFGRHRYAAAVLADSASGGYFDYLLSPPQVQDDYDHILGAAPFGAGLKDWAERSPMFNFNRIDTPTRVLAFGPKILFQYENLAAARRLDKSLELVWLPAAHHWPIHPSERMEAQQGSVDWYAFWLMGKSGVSPAARRETLRWKAMRSARLSSSDARAQRVSSVMTNDAPTPRHLQAPADAGS